MVRVIQQETFDEIVKENIDEFGMTPDEAVRDATKQFEAQGIDLSNIVKDLSIIGFITEEHQSLVKVINNIQNLVSVESPSPELALLFASFTEECDKGIAHKLLASKNGAYPLLLTALEIHSKNLDIVSPALNAMISLMTGQPDLLDDRGIKLIMELLDTHSSEPILEQILQWIKVCCLKHESNRQNIFKADILERLKKFLVIDEISPPLIRPTCAVMRALILDDDVRVEYGNSYEHARMIAQEFLHSIVALLKTFRDDPDMVSHLVLTLATLVVRKEFCDKVAEAHGIVILIDVLTTYTKHEKLIRMNFKLLKALAGSDDVKDKILKSRAAPLITNAMYVNRKSASLTAAGCACIAALSLRSPENSKILCDSGAAEVVIEGMKAHPNDVDVQRQGCSAIRNIVSRARDLSSGFLEMGAEDLLKDVLKIHKENCESEAKAALRDLGCDVKLKECWSGKGGALN